MSESRNVLFAVTKPKVISFAVVVLGPLLFFPFHMRLTTTGLGNWKMRSWESFKEYALNERRLYLYDHQGKLLMDLPVGGKHEAIAKVLNQYLPRVEFKEGKGWFG